MAAELVTVTGLVDRFGSPERHVDSGMARYADDDTGGVSFRTINGSQLSGWNRRA